MNDPLAIDPGRIRACLEDHGEQHLRAYFDNFTGRRFERFAGGGDRPDVAAHFTSEDIVAVSMLSVRVPGRASLELLEQRAADVAELLPHIPTDLDLWHAEDDDIGPGSPAWRLWALLEGLPGVGWVTAGKLLARKRPRLIPVYDRVVQAVLDRPDGAEYWRPLRDVLRDNDGIVHTLEDLRSAVGLDDIALLRVLDVVLWMHGTRGMPEVVLDADS